MTSTKKRTHKRSYEDRLMEYERRKRELWGQDLSAAEYERKIREIVRELGI